MSRLDGRARHERTLRPGAWSLIHLPSPCPLPPARSGLEDVERWSGGLYAALEVVWLPARAS